MSEDPNIVLSNLTDSLPVIKITIIVLSEVLKKT